MKSLQVGVFFCVISTLSWSQSVADIYISEMLINADSVTGSGADEDKEFIELASTTGGVESLAGLTFVYIEGDTSTSNPDISGQVDFVLPLDPYTLGSNGLVVFTDGPNFANGLLPWEPAADAATPVNYVEFDNLDGSGNDLENGSATFLLVEGWTLGNTTGLDLDNDNNGMLDFIENGTPAPWTNLVDVVGWTENSTNTEYAYSAQLGGPQFDGQAASFDPDGYVVAPDGAHVFATHDLDVDFLGNGPYILDDDGTPANTVINTANQFDLTPNPAFVMTPGSANSIDITLASGPDCDLDGDTDCDGDDIDQLYDDIASAATGADSDLDGSGTTDNNDIDDWLASAGVENGKVYLPGDVNLDGSVGGSDFTTFASNFGMESGDPPPYWGTGNFDGEDADGIFRVGGGDFTALAANFGHVSTNSVPEPSSYF